MHDQIEVERGREKEIRHIGAVKGRADRVEGTIRERESGGEEDM